jgi:excinuclease UvrABC nuclease subunit
MSDSKLVTPGDLRKLTEDAQRAKVQEQFNRARQLEEEQKAIREAFMSRDVHPQVKERVNAAVRRAAEQGLHEFEVMKFPAEYCNDKGRRINNAEPDWPSSLEGFAKRAYDFFVKELQPLGFKVRAQILNYPDGRLGDVGFFLSW